MRQLYFFILITLFLQNCSSSVLDRYPEIDLVIRHAEIVDGTGLPAYTGDVFIVGEEIVHISRKKEDHPNIRQTIEAEGRILAPGFIDLHSHGDPEKTPVFENFLAMGVTTISLGQDGFSPAEQDLKSWMERVGGDGFGPNIVQFVGHGTLRNLTGIGSEVEVGPEKLAEMKTLLAQNLEACFGLSTGLEYNPGLFAPEAELIELAKVVGSKERMIMSHMRNEDDNAVVGSMEELIRQGEHARVHIAHLKSVYGKGTQRAEEILEVMHEARARGVQLSADLYPYTASYTGIGIVFPDWAKTKDQFQVAVKNRRGELEAFLRNKVQQRNGPEATLLGTDPYKGKTLADLEKELEKPFEQILIEDLGPGGASGAYFVMDQDLQNRLLVDSIVSICSDGSPTGYHPRGHGTFARVIEEFVVKKQLLSLEAAVHKMTGYAADILHLTNRGRIQVGKKADLILFDPARVKAKADYTDPFQLAEGFDWVIVNGKIVREKGVLQPVQPGRFLFPD